MAAGSFLCDGPATERAILELMLAKIRSFGRRVNHYHVPKTLLLNNVSLKASELRKVLRENAIERGWYKGIQPYRSLADIILAVETGKLVRVVPTDNYQPIMRLSNPMVAEMYPGYLTSEAKQLLDEVGTAWRQAMGQAGLDSKIKLAVTSLVRTVSYQQAIVRAGKLADPDSVHTRGEAFDIDGSGYYIGSIPINARKDRQDDFKNAFRELGAAEDAPEFGDYKLYQPEVHQMLGRVLDHMQSQEKLHFVVEYADTTNQTFHICRHPSYNIAKD